MSRQQSHHVVVLVADATYISGVGSRLKRNYRAVHGVVPEIIGLPLNLSTAAFTPAATRQAEEFVAYSRGVLAQFIVPDADTRISALYAYDQFLASVNPPLLRELHTLAQELGVEIAYTQTLEEAFKAHPDYPAYLSDNRDDILIEELDLGPGDYGALKDAKIATLGELLGYSVQDLLGLDMWQEHIDEVTRVLEGINLSLRQDD